MIEASTKQLNSNMKNANVYGQNVTYSIAI